MYRLTERRLRKAEPILEKYRDQLHRQCHFAAGQFEVELRRCWNLGYQQLKDIARDLLRHERYRYVAIYYMEHSNTPGVSSEFKLLLAKIYGIKRYDSPDMPIKRDGFWAMFRKAAANRRIKD